MSKPHDISGLVAWAKRAEWRDSLAEFLDRHSAQACAAAGIEMEDIEDVLGGDAAQVLWGAAFEDLVATDLPAAATLRTTTCAGAAGRRARPPASISRACADP